MYSRTKTMLKFVKSERTGAWVGYASINTKSKRVNGVREDEDVPKKVCVAARDLKDDIEPGVLYDVEMVRMKNRNAGYVVVDAKPHQFEAKMDGTIVKDAVYKICVSFGNKTITFNPMDGKKKSVKTIDGVVDVLKDRKDLKDKDRVIDEFKKYARFLLKRYEEDGFYVSKEELREA